MTRVRRLSYHILAFDLDRSRMFQGTINVAREKGPNPHGFQQLVSSFK